MFSKFAQTEQTLVYLQIGFEYFYSDVIIAFESLRNHRQIDRISENERQNNKKRAN
jgi:hypothetical protein